MTNKPRRIAARSSALLALIGFVFLAAGAATWFYPPPPEFTARMKLHVAPNPPRILFQDKDSDEVDRNGFLRSQAELIRDRYTIVATLRDPMIANLSMLQEQKDAAQWLEEKLTVELPSPEYMNITLSGDRGEDLIQIVAAVTKAYMENFVNKERNDRRQHLGKIENRKKEFERMLEQLRLNVQARQAAAEGFDPEGVALHQKIAAEDLDNVLKDLLQVRRDLRNLRWELSVHPDWVGQVLPWCAAATLNVQSGPVLPINYVANLALWQQVTQQNLLQIQEKLRPFEAKEKALLSEAVRLSEQSVARVKQGMDLTQWHDDIDQVRKIVAQLNEKLNQLAVELEAPPRITPMYGKPILVKPNEIKRKMTMAGAPALAGLGMLLLVLAVFRFRTREASNIVEH